MPIWRQSLAVLGLRVTEQVLGMAPRDIEQQFSPDQLGLLVAAILGKKSGVDLSSALSDPFLAYLSGASTGQRQLSEGELYARFGPTFLFIAENEPEGSWRKQAAAMISTGVPAYRVKEQVQNLLATNPELQGMSTSKDVDSFIEGLASEYQKVQTEAIKQTENDPFAKAGYPNPDAQYTEEDIVRMAPEAFSALQQKAEAGRPQYEKLIAGIDAKYSKPAMMEAPAEGTAKKGKSPGRAYQDVTSSDTVRRGVANFVGQKYGIDANQVMAPDKNDPKQVEANKMFVEEVEKRANLAKFYAENRGEVGGAVKTAGKAAVGATKVASIVSNPLLGLAKLVPNLFKSDGLTPTERKMQKEQGAQKEEAQPVMVEDKVATARNKAIADVAKNLIASRVGMPGYYEQAMGLLAQNIQSDLAKSGRTPLGDALIKSAVLARATRKNG